MLRTAIVLLQARVKGHRGRVPSHYCRRAGTIMGVATSSLGITACHGDEAGNTNTESSSVRWIVGGGLIAAAAYVMRPVTMSKAGQPSQRSPTTTNNREDYEQAAEQGDAEALCSLGIMCAEGKGGPEDMIRARELFEKAAAQGHANAQYNLGNMHYNGRGGFTVNMGRARELFQQAADQGHVGAQSDLDRIYKYW